MNAILWWGQETRYVLSAGAMACLPGASVGILVAFFTGLQAWVVLASTLLVASAVSFVVLFPPILLSVLESESALTPIHNETWNSIRERPDPWKLAYLITAVFAVAGVMGTLISLSSGLVGGQLGAIVMAACLMIYFRTLGRLRAFLAGRDVVLAHPSQQP